MNRTRLSGVDILGISLAVVVTLIVIGSVVTIARGRTREALWSFLGGDAPWKAGDFSFGTPVREERDEPVPPGATEIDVRNVAGSIDISGSTTAATVTVHSVKTAPFRSALNNVHVALMKEGNRLVIAEKHDAGFMMRTGTVSFHVVVPRGMATIAAHSVSGGISVTGVEPGIDQNLSTISGGIATEKARNLDASSTSGSIHFNSSGQAVNVRTVSGSIDGVIESLDGGGTAHFGTVSGSVSLGAFPRLDATISLHSLSGRVSCSFPMTISEQKNNRLNGAIGKGSASLDVGTVSGSITLWKM